MRDGERHAVSGQISTLDDIQRVDRELSAANGKRLAGVKTNGEIEVERRDAVKFVIRIIDNVQERVEPDAESADTPGHDDNVGEFVLVARECARASPLSAEAVFFMESKGCPASSAQQSVGAITRRAFIDCGRPICLAGANHSHHFSWASPNTARCVVRERRPPAKSSSIDENVTTYAWRHGSSAHYDDNTVAKHHEPNAVSEDDIKAGRSNVDCVASVKAEQKTSARPT